MKTPTLLALLATSTILLAACAPDTTTQSEELQPIATPVVTSDSYATHSGTIASSTPSASPLSSSTTKGKAMQNEVKTAVIETDKGSIELELYPDKAPNTVKNFITKVQSGFYKGLTFHRVEDWVIQGGDPQGNGTGGGKMPAEYNQEPFVIGSLGVARGMDKSQNNDSQFFICTADCGWLTNEYTNFGKVTKGMDVVKKIAIGDKITNIATK